MSHQHKCMSCGESWNCPIPDSCLAQPNVLPTIVLTGPNGAQIFDHVCQRKPTARPEERPKNQRIGSPALIAKLRDCAKHKNGPPLLLDEAADWIELLEREWLDMRHDLDRAMANHNAELNQSPSSSQKAQP